VVCRRGPGDKLLDILTREWSVNLLRIPRGGIHVGDVFVVQRTVLDQWDRLEELYQPKLQLPVPDCQPVGDMEGVESRSYGTNDGFRALQGFLQGLGVPPLPLQATIKAARSATLSLSFSVGNVSRTALLPGEIKREMDSRARGARWRSIDVKRRYVVVHAVWEATSLQIKLAGSAKTVGGLVASLTNVATATVGLKASHDSSGTIKYERGEPITFGIQVTGVQFGDGIPRLEGAPDLAPMQVRHEGDTGEIQTDDQKFGVLIGERGGNPFVSLR
jgi:hypothetical protein